MKTVNLNVTKWIITFLSPCLVFFFCASEVFTPDLRMYFVITLFAILLMSFDLVPTILPAILLPTLYVVSEIAPPEVVFSPWSGTTIFMILGAFVLANTLEACGLLNRIAVRCIILFGCSYTSSLYAIFITGVVIGLITFNTAYVIMPVFAYGVARAFGYDKPCKEAGLLVFMGAVGSTGAGACTYNPAYIGIIRGALENWNLPWYAQTLYNWPIFIAVLLFIFIVTKLWKTDSVSSEYGRKYFQELNQKMGPMGESEKKAALLIVALVVYLLIAPILGFNIAFGFMIIPWLAFLPGINIASKEVVDRLQYPIIFFIAGCMSIGTVGAYLGIGEYISSLLLPTMSQVPVVGVLVVTLLIGVLSNIVMTPYAMAATLSAPLVEISLSLGLNPDALLMTLLMSTDLYFFPHEFAALVVVYGFGLIKISDFIKLASLKTIVFFLVYIFLQIPYWMLCGYLMR